ncbi:25870_t:CDS:2, partial [Dentiscutata erythropus]
KVEGKGRMADNRKVQALMSFWGYPESQEPDGSNNDESDDELSDEEDVFSVQKVDKVEIKELGISNILKGAVNKDKVEDSTKKRDNGTIQELDAAVVARLMKENWVSIDMGPD